MFLRLQRLRSYTVPPMPRSIFYLKISDKPKKGARMALIAIMAIYNIPASSAKHMLEVLSEEKINECIQEYWQREERKFNG